MDGSQEVHCSIRVYSLASHASKHDEALATENYLLKKEALNLVWVK